MCSDVSSLTRRELYNLVWKKPVQAVAKDYGISDRGLGKLCERHGIPVPPRGYWARKAAGQKVVKPPLIDVTGVVESDRGVVLAKTTSVPRPYNISNVRDVPDDDLKTMWEAQLDEKLALQVPKSLSNPHAVIVRVLDEKKAEAQRWDFSPSPYLSRPTGFTSLERRQLRIIDVLLKTFSGSGVEMEMDARTFTVSIRQARNEPVRFSVREHIRQYRRKLTEEEQLKSWSGKQTWSQEREATGKLVLKIENFVPSKIPLIFHETADEPLEGKLREIVASIVVTLAHELMRREKFDLDERNRHAERLAAWKAEQERKAEESKKEALRTDAKRWRQAANLREYVAFVVAAAAAGRPVNVGTDIEAWSKWALAHADEIDPTTPN